MPEPLTADARPLVLLSAAPRRVEQIFTAQRFAELTAEFDVLLLDEPGVDLDARLPEAFAIVGQPDLGPERLRRAPALRAVLNVEGNFLANVDYPTCFQRGIHVLGCGPAYAQAVAEYALGLAIDLCRGISREDRAFRAGAERYVADGTSDSILLRGADIGLVGFGNLGRALCRLLAPFAATVRGYDPWLPDAVLREHGVRPASLEQTLRASQVLFVLATVTEQSTALLGATQLDLVPAGARVVLASRAAVVDFDALVERVEAGRFLAAVDVWPHEPVPPNHPARHMDGFVLSAHRAGGIPSAFFEVGELVFDDLRLIKAGLPPARMQPAAPELVGRYRNRPVS